MRAKRQAGFELGVEDIQRPGDLMAIYHFNAACWGKTHHRQQDVVQTKRFKQQHAYAVEEGAENAGALDDMPNTRDAQRDVFPQHGNEQTHQRQGERGNNRHETNAAKEGEGVMQNRVLKTVMQKIGDNPNHNAT